MWASRTNLLKVKPILIFSEGLDLPERVCAAYDTLRTGRVVHTDCPLHVWRVSTRMKNNMMVTLIDEDVYNKSVCNTCCS